MLIQGPEKFLLDCITSYSERDLRDITARFYEKGSQINWSNISDGKFKIFLPLYLQIKRVGEHLRIQPELENTIKLKYIVNCERNELIRKAIIELQCDFSNHKIDIMFLKGAALLSTIYKDDIGIRQMGDIDILIRKRDVLNAENLLGRMGYREDYERFSQEIGLSPCSYLSKNSLSYHYVYYKGNVKLELHWHITDKFDKSMSIVYRLFDSSMTTKINGTNMVRIINPEGMIFLACINFIKDFPTFFSSACFMPESKNKDDFYQFLFFCYEVKKIIKYHENKVAWDNFIILSETAKIEYEIFTLLLLAHKISNMDIPNNVIKKMGLNFPVGLYLYLSRHLKYTDLRELLFYRNLILRLTNYRMLFKNPFRFIKSIFGISKVYLHFYMPYRLG